MQVRVAKLDSGADLQGAAELRPAPLHAVQVSGHLRRRRLADAVGDSAADGLIAGGGLVGDDQCGEVCVIGEGYAGRTGTPDDVAAVVALSIGSGYVTGTVIACDGGLRLR
jgi:NAD(P)-dependent dehydrogenase (short-subunit alcohol dehydrogenase family)